MSSTLIPLAYVFVLEDMFRRARNGELVHDEEYRKLGLNPNNINVLKLEEHTKSKFKRPVNDNKYGIYLPTMPETPETFEIPDYKLEPEIKPETENKPNPKPYPGCYPFDDEYTMEEHYSIYKTLQPSVHGGNARFPTHVTRPVTRPVTKPDTQHIYYTDDGKFHTF